MHATIALPACSGNFGSTFRYVPRSKQVLYAAAVGCHWAGVLLGVVRLGYKAMTLIRDLMNVDKQHW